MEVRAFRGWRFDPGVVGDPGTAISPPYDVIGEEQRRRLIERNPYNIVQVIRPEPPPEETERDNRYTRAADTFRKWREEGVLRPDPEPAIYVYGQTFDEGGATRTRLGFVGLCRLEPFGKGIRPHEWTMGGPKQDRLRLTRATRAQFGQIFVLYSDPERDIDAVLEEATASAPILDATDDEGVRHVLWAITDPARIAQIEKRMADRTLLVADGHHRYETAVKYHKENRDLEEAAWQLMTFVNMKNEGLVILPTHRLVKNIEGFDRDAILKKLEEEFEVETFAGMEGGLEGRRDRLFAALGERGSAGRHAFGVYLGAQAFHLATLRSEEAIEAIPGVHSDAWKRLDVTILHSRVLDRLLGIDEQKLDSGEHVEYVKGAGDAVDRAVRTVDAGAAQAAFFVNPPRMDEVERIAEAGERMPRKSTFFHPKVFSGLVVHVLE